MNLDFDLLSNDVSNKVKAGSRFQPKAKPKPQPKPKPKPKPQTQPEPISAPTSSSQFVEPAAVTATLDNNEIIGKTKEDLPENGVNKIFGNNIDKRQPSFEKSQEENADSVHTLDLLNDFLPESTTTAVNITPSVNDENLETRPVELDFSTKIDVSTNLESIAEVDPLTGEEGTIFNDNEVFHIEDLSSGLKDAEILPSWESLDVLSESKTRPGLRVCKFKPKPKAKTCKVEKIANTPDQDVGRTQYDENIHSCPTETDLTDIEHVPSFTRDESFGSPSIRETINMEETSQVDSMNEAGRYSERLRRRTNKTLGLIDESEDEGIDNTLVHGTEDYDNNDDYVPQNESLSHKKGTKSMSKSKSKSMKPVNEKEKPVRKRKKSGEVTDESTKVTKKKFSHRTQRNKRPVDPELLKIPEDELELHMHNVPMKELIRLAEHRERLAKKDASTSGTSATNQSNEDGGSLAQGMGSDYEHGVPTDAQNATYYNYRTHMKITPRMKWSKQDTELFYEAIQQFGTDLSMIKECFPGRTREQIKSKYKKEERQQPLRLNDALTTRAIGHSHFEVVIERLKQAQGEESEDDEPINLTGEEDEVAATDINGGGAVNATKPEQLEKEVKVDVPSESPTKSHDSEDDMFRWSQYKSDI